MALQRKSFRFKIFSKMCNIIKNIILCITWKSFFEVFCPDNFRVNISILNYLQNIKATSKIFNLIFLSRSLNFSNIKMIGHHWSVVKVFCPKGKYSFYSSFEGKNIFPALKRFRTFLNTFLFRVGIKKYLFPCVKMTIL